MNLPNIILIPKGAYSSNNVMKFYNTGLARSTIISGQDNNHSLSEMLKAHNDDLIQIETLTIDEMLSSEKATYIKMDIEGSELEALKGAKQTIQKHKPRLAISIYHKNNDILDIPQYILELNDSYKFYIRQYIYTPLEVVLYAI